MWHDNITLVITFVVSTKATADICFITYIAFATLIHIVMSTVPNFIITSQLRFNVINNYCETIVHT
jgi:hypothetical protein